MRFVGKNTSCCPIFRQIGKIFVLNWDVSAYVESFRSTVFFFLPI